MTDKKVRVRINRVSVWQWLTPWIWNAACEYCAQVAESQADHARSLKRDSPTEFWEGAEVNASQIATLIRLRSTVTTKPDNILWRKYMETSESWMKTCAELNALRAAAMEDSIQNAERK